MRTRKSRAAGALLMMLLCILVLVGLIIFLCLKDRIVLPGTVFPTYPAKGEAVTTTFPTYAPVSTAVPQMASIQTTTTRTTSYDAVQASMNFPVIGNTLGGPSNNGTTAYTSTSVQSTPAPVRDEFPDVQVQNEEWVRKVQTALVNRGYQISIDGKFGPQTAVAVKQFQLSAGIKVDGIAGYDTSKALGISGWSKDLTVRYAPDLKAIAESSGQSRLIYISNRTNRLIVFKKASNGYWTIELCVKCITGNASKGTWTPDGVTSILGSSDSFSGTNDSGRTYVCYNANWISNEGHAIHSILYYPDTGTWDTTKLAQGKSHGCIRVANDIAAWIRTLPVGTPVVIDDRYFSPGDRDLRSN